MLRLIRIAVETYQPILGNPSSHRTIVDQVTADVSRSLRTDSNKSLDIPARIPSSRL